MYKLIAVAVVIASSFTSGYLVKKGANAFHEYCIDNKTESARISYQMGDYSKEIREHCEQEAQKIYWDNKLECAERLQDIAKSSPKGDR